MDKLYSLTAAQQIRNQRMHARGGEEHGRVILRNNGGAGNDSMALALEEIEPHRAQLAGSHLLHGGFSPYDDDNLSIAVFPRTIL